MMMSSSGTCQYPLSRSNVEKLLAFPIRNNVSSILGNSLETITFGGPNETIKNNNETVKNNNETLEEKFLICASFASCKCSTLLSPSLQATEIGTPSRVTDGVTAETIANATKKLKDDIVAQGGNTRTLDSLLQQLHTLHGKEKEFLFGTISVLQKESKAKCFKYTLSSSLEELQENNEALKNSLEKANSRIADLEQNLEPTSATESQLQNLLKRKEENNAAVETEGQEIINKLEGEMTRLIQKLSTAENQIKQVSETAEQLQKEIKVLADRLDKASTENINLKTNLLDFTSKNKNLEKDLQELQDRV
ncbi:hypothetical protein OUZ56_017192 [Daphnia magna]|uniref:Uncharacterized protein n=1 Tax=Daphnia magna TaxID=35525 RepID=A0ABR0ASD7_9CRUS|nr:hypothetical protein OUZ56_017192 [Daphnia magna]